MRTPALSVTVEGCWGERGWGVVADSVMTAAKATVEAAARPRMEGRLCDMVGPPAASGAVFDIQVVNDLSASPKRQTKKGLVVV